MIAKFDAAKLGKQDEKEFTKVLTTFCISNVLKIHQFADRFAAYGRIPAPPCDYLVSGKTNWLFEYKASTDTWINFADALTDSQQQWFYDLGRTGGNYAVIKHQLVLNSVGKVSEAESFFFLILAREIVPVIDVNVAEHKKTKYAFELCTIANPVDFITLCEQIKELCNG